MNWYWKIRIYATSGEYAICQIKTERDLAHIDTIKDFYELITGCKMLLEGMSEKQYDSVPMVWDGFKCLIKCGGFNAKSSNSR